MRASVGVVGLIGEVVEVRATGFGNDIRLPVRAGSGRVTGGWRSGYGGGSNGAGYECGGSSGDGRGSGGLSVSCEIAESEDESAEEDFGLHFEKKR